MGRKYDVDAIHLKIDALIPFVNEKFTGFTIQWSSDIGFGEYLVSKPIGSQEWHADSEHMDSNEDKVFIRKLLMLFIDALAILD